MKTFMFLGVEHSEEICPSCMASENLIRVEALMPIPAGVRAPRSQLPEMGRICFDCAGTETLRRFLPGVTWAQARIAVANTRQERLRLPGAPIGFAWMRHAQEGDLDALHAWQARTFPPELLDKEK